MRRLSALRFDTRSVLWCAVRFAVPARAPTEYFCLNLRLDSLSASGIRCRTVSSHLLCVLGLQHFYHHGCWGDFVQWKITRLESLIVFFRKLEADVGLRDALKR